MSIFLHHQLSQCINYNLYGVARVCNYSMLFQTIWLIGSKRFISRGSSISNSNLFINFVYIIYQTIFITIPIKTTTTKTNLTNYVILTLDLTSKDVKQTKTLPISWHFFCKLKSRAILILLFEKLCQQNKYFVCCL